jgi:hypothetical protein
MPSPRRAMTNTLFTIGHAQSFGMSPDELGLWAQASMPGRHRLAPSAVISLECHGADVLMALNVLRPFADAVDVLYAASPGCQQEAGMCSAQ